MNYMKYAVEEAYNGIRAGHGGPFGSVIVKDGKIIGSGHNRVLADHDPTMHGEVAAIRDACRNIESHDLKGSILYTTAYPCPMCMSAILWAGVDKVVYGCTVDDTAEIGFRDDDFYKALESGEPVPLKCEDRKLCRDLFDEYNRSEAERY